ncbi:hypothetical protein ACFWP2_02500 [Kitasatospora sp. NPDC058444]
MTTVRPARPAGLPGFLALALAVAAESGPEGGSRQVHRLRVR